MKQTLKRLFLLILTLAMVTGAALPASAADWKLSPENDDSATVEGNKITLSYPAGSGSRSAYAEKAFDFSEYEHINISFTARIKGTGDEINRKLYIRQSSTRATEILAFSGDVLSVLGTDTDKIIEEDTDYEMTVGVNPAENSLSVYMNGENVFSGDMGTKWKSNFDLSALKVYIRNNTTAAESGASEFVLDDFAVTDKVTDFTSEPEDGSSYIDAAQIENAVIEFDGVVSPETFKNDNFILTANGNECVLDASGNGTKAVIVPEGGFLSNATYVLTVKSVKDVFGNEVLSEKEISFTTAPDGYSAPTVSISSDKTAMYDSEKATIELLAETEFGLEKIELYLNDELKESFTESTTYYFNGEEGTYKFYIIAYDALGGKAQSETLTITVAENIPPVIEVSGVVSGEPILRDELSAIEITAQDSGEIVSLTASVGGNVILETNESSALLDLSNLSYGRYLLIVTATDDAGAVTTEEISLIVAADSTESIKHDSDYSNYTGASYPSGVNYMHRPEGCNLGPSTAYGEEHGTVVEFTTDGGSSEGGWMNFDTAGTTNAFVLEMDLYVIPGSKVMFYYKTDSVTLAPFIFENDAVQLHRTNGSYITVDWPAGEWHKIKACVDISTHLQDIWIDGELVAKDFGISAGLAQITTRIALTPGDEKKGVAIDNIKISYTDVPVQIVSVGYDNVSEATVVLPTADKLVFTMNGLLKASSLTNDSAVLYCGDRPMKYKNISWSSANKQITVTLAERLKSKESYSFELTDKVMDASDKALIGGARASFETGYADFDVKNATLTKTSGKIKVNASFINKTTDKAQCFAIVNILSGNKLDKTFVKKITVDAESEPDMEIASLDISSGQRAELYFWKTLSGQEAITDVFTY